MKTCPRGSMTLCTMKSFFIIIGNTSAFWPEGESQMDWTQMAHEDAEVSKIPWGELKVFLGKK